MIEAQNNNNDETIVLLLQADAFFQEQRGTTRKGKKRKNGRLDGQDRKHGRCFSAGSVWRLGGRNGSIPAGEKSDNVDKKSTTCQHDATGYRRHAKKHSAFIFRRDSPR